MNKMYEQRAEPLATIAQAITAYLPSCVERVPTGYQATLQIPPPHFDADYTTSFFQVAKINDKQPAQIGALVGAHLLDQHLIRSYEVVAGFLNLQLHPLSWKKMLSATSHLLHQRRSNGKRSLVEFASPNTNKPLHLGHLRNIFLGNAVANLLEERGDVVVRINHINDRGIHICKSMVAYQQAGAESSPQTTARKGDHFVGDYYVQFNKTYLKEVEELQGKGLDLATSKAKAPSLLAAQELLLLWEQGHPPTLKLWERMNQWVYAGFAATLKKINISFDRTYYESATYLKGKAIVLKELASKIFYKKEDGSVWCDLTGEGFDEKLLLRKDGTTVYITQDIGTAEIRSLDYGDFDQAIYVVGNEQIYHFKVLFAILKKLKKGYASRLHHFSYGMVELPFGKMKSREGTTVDADDIIQKMIQKAAEKTQELQGATAKKELSLYEKVGLGAIKYFLLKVHPKKKIFFNPDSSIDFQGDTCAFVQYTYARINSLLKKGGAQHFSVDALPTLTTLLPEERRLCRDLYHYNQVREDAIKELNPSLLVHHCYQLAKAYNSFYRACPIVKGDAIAPAVRSWRLFLSQLTAEELKKMTRLLGIALPDRM